MKSTRPPMILTIICLIGLVVGIVLMVLGSTQGTVQCPSFIDADPDLYENLSVNDLCYNEYRDRGFMIAGGFMLAGATFLGAVGFGIWWGVRASSNRKAGNPPPYGGGPGYPPQPPYGTAPGQPGFPPPGQVPQPGQSYGGGAQPPYAPPANPTYGAPGQQQAPYGQPGAETSSPPGFSPQPPPAPGAQAPAVQPPGPAQPPSPPSPQVPPGPPPGPSATPGTDQAPFERPPHDNV